VNFDAGRRRADWDVAEGRFAPIYLDGRLFPLKGTRARFELGVDPEEANISEGLAELWWGHPFGHALTFQYRYLRDIPAFYEDFSQQNERFENFVDQTTVSQLSGTVHTVFSRQWSADYTLVYSFDLSDLIAQRGTVMYRSRCNCWGLGFAISDSRNRGVQFKVVYELLGFGGRNGTPTNFLSDLGLVDGF
jgi:lipopolysaccharide assembly outer membrane protein LptD (OstA)